MPKEGLSLVKNEFAQVNQLFSDDFLKFLFKAYVSNNNFITNNKVEHYST